MMQSDFFQLSEFPTTRMGCPETPILFLVEDPLRELYKAREVLDVSQRLC